jgi:hypothetical protein
LPSTIYTHAISWGFREARRGVTNDVVGILEHTSDVLNQHVVLESHKLDKLLGDPGLED